ncbi:MAG: hypothetical protein AMXMBFR53_01950 [Gemmatimonadota bacterium]
MRYAPLAVAICMVAHQGPGRSAAQAPPRQVESAVEQYLRRIGLRTTQLDSVARGQVVVHSLPGGTDRDVAVVGVVRVTDDSEVVRTRALDVQGLLAASGKRFGLLSDPATDADVLGASLDDSEYQSLRDCHPGDCDFKLPAEAMRSFLDRVDWSGPTAKAQADSLVRAGLLRLAADYRARGNAATPPFDDLRGVRSGEVFEALLDDSPLVYEYAPELQRYLVTYPSRRPQGVRELLYWSEDRLPRLRPLLTLNHVVIYSPSPSTALLARKQLYASHYLEGAFELLAVVDTRAGADSGATYLLALRRFRFDNLPGGPANVRGRVLSQLVEATRADLLRLADGSRPPPS